MDLRPRLINGSWPLPAPPEPAMDFVEPEDPIDGGNEAIKLLYNNQEIEVKKYKEKPMRIIRNVRVTRVVTPYLFFLEFDHSMPLLGFSDWRKAMQEFYNDKQASRFYEVTTSYLFKYRCYAYLDPYTKLWERVRLMKYDTVTANAEIYLFEHNEFRIVPRSAIMELAQEFTKWSAQAFPSHLINISPADGSVFWSKESVDYFKKLVDGKSFYCIVLSRSETQLPEGFPENIEYVGVSMLQREPSKGQLTLQAEMVKAGMADATGCLGGYVDIMRSGGGEIGRFVLEKFEMADLELLTAKGSKLEEKPSASDVRETWKSLMNKGENIRTKSHYSTVDNHLEFTPDMLGQHFAKHSHNIPQTFKQSMCQIRFSHMLNPSIIYLQLENNITELREMETALTLLVENDDPIPYDEALAGVFVACLLQIDRFREPTFVRAVIRHPLVGVNLLKVVLIDYGSEISVRPKSIRHLPPYFLNIPSFCFRAHLDSPMTIPSGGRLWTSDASDTFRKYMNAWNLLAPIYYAWRSKSNEAVPIADFNQQLFWDPLTHKWMGFDNSFSPLNSAINRMRDHPLLYNLFTSIGLDIVYEVTVGAEEQGDYAFESLGDMLADSGFAMRLLPVKTNWGQHASIVMAIQDYNYMNNQKEVLE